MTDRPMQGQMTLWEEPSPATVDDDESPPTKKSVLFGFSSESAASKAGSGAQLCALSRSRDPSDLTRSISVVELRRWFSDEGCETEQTPLPPLPKTRGECPTERPCPHVRCRHHLYLEVSAGGAIRINFPGMEPWEIPESCSLDVADSEVEMDEEKLGRLMGISAVGVRKLLYRVINKIVPRFKRFRHYLNDLDQCRFETEHPLAEAQREAPGKKGWLSRDDTKGKGPWNSKQR